MEKRGMYVVGEKPNERRIKITAWVDAKASPPTHVGWYNTKGAEGLEHGNRHYWQDGEFWEFGVAAGILKVRRAVQVSQYQGLSEKCSRKS